MLTTVIGILLFSNIVLAIPGTPHQFYGTVTWNGSPAPDGLSVVAKINGKEVASTTTKNGKYGYVYPEGEEKFYVPDTDPPSRIGSDINFFVNGVDTGQTEIFVNAKITSLDLSATGGEPSPPPSGGGGGGGGFVPPEITEEEEEEEVTTEQPCQERWICEDWSECKDGEQTRTCEEVNNCGTDRDIPLMVQPCSTVETEETEAAGEALLPTGFFLGLTTADWVIGIIVGAIVAAVIIFLVSRRKRK